MGTLARRRHHLTTKRHNHGNNLVRLAAATNACTTTGERKGCIPAAGSVGTSTSCTAQKDNEKHTHRNTHSMDRNAGKTHGNMQG